MADLRIVDAPEIPTENITGEEKLPTGGNGNYSISLDSLADYTKTKKDLADNTSVDGKVNGVRQELDAHIEDLLNPHQVTKGQIGLGNVDNTADADKPVSNSTQAAIISAVAPKADKNYVDNALSGKSDKTYVDTQLALKANKADVYTKLETYTKQESNDLVNNSISTALTPVSASLELAKRGIANRYDTSLTYNLGERVVLTNGDIVKSTINGNTNDPNANMTGWVYESVKTVQETAFILTPQMFGAKGDGVTDDYDAFFKCFNAFPELAALNIYIPPKTYKISKTLFITRPHKISGPSGSEAVKSILDFNGSVVSGMPSYKGALWVYHSNTAPNIPLPSGQVGSYGGGACIEGVAVINSPEHGIVVNAPTTVSECRASANTKSGVVIVGGGVGGGNANHSLISHTRSTGNGNSGIFMAGSDGNTFTIIGCVVTANAHYGINDASLLGGLVMGCEADSNGLAAYNQRGGAADNSGLGASPSRTVWVGNYAESNQPYNYSLNSRSTVIGATGAQPESGNGYFANTAAGMYSARTLAVASNEQVAYDESADFGKIGAGLLRLGWAGVAQKFRVTHSLGYVNIGTDAGTGNQISLRVGSNFNNAITVDRPYFPKGFALSTNHAQTAASAAPTSGSYEKGHVVWNANPVAGGFAGWICVAAGTPGTWKTFGAISA